MRRLNVVVAGAHRRGRRRAAARLAADRRRPRRARAGSSATRRPGSPGPCARSAEPGDRVFNPQPWGSWFKFELPDLPVAIDSRIELFPVEVWDDYERVVDGGDGWQQLDDWEVTVVVAAGASEDAFVARLEAAGWTTVYADGDGTVLRRSAPLAVVR